MTRLCLALLLGGAGCAAAGTPEPPSGVEISDEQALAIGRKIYQNEAGGKVEFLTHWNDGEYFASLGIGHFIWYPKSVPQDQRRFEESFPRLLAFLKEHGAQPPAWVSAADGCPWDSKAEFDGEKKKKSPRIKELQDFLAATIALQARFAAGRLKDALPKMLEALPESERPRVAAQFQRTAKDPRGLYPLMDYVNFKGEGVKTSERYNDEGWGLLQVLQGMNGDAPGQPALDAFARSAGDVLRRRVKNCQTACPDPKRRADEIKWLGDTKPPTGWLKRVDGYRQP